MNCKKQAPRHDGRGAYAVQRVPTASFSAAFLTESLSADFFVVFAFLGIRETSFWFTEDIFPYLRRNIHTVTFDIRKGVL